MPRQVDPNERRAKIVDAVFGILANQGVSVLSIRSVARAVGVTTGMVTHWFASRDALLEAAVEIAAEREERRAREVAKTGADLAASMAAFLPLDAERADEVRVWIGFRAASIGNEALLTFHRRRYRAWASQLVKADLVSNVQSALSLIAIVDGISIDAVLDPECWPADEQLAALKSALRMSDNRSVGAGLFTVIC